MKFLKFSFLFLSLSFMITSCGDETCDDLAATMIGSWSADVLGAGNVVINADGTFVDSNNLIFDASFDNADKTWTAATNASFDLNATENGQTTFFQFPVSSFDCETINTEDSAGNPIIFRKN